MPLYEFECGRCGHVFEKLQSVQDPNPPCPVTTGEMLLEDGRTFPTFCGGKTNKLISRTSFQLKGGGWASDGYGK